MTFEEYLARVKAENETATDEQVRPLWAAGVSPDVAAISPDAAKIAAELKGTIDGLRHTIARFERTIDALEGAGQ